MQLQRIDRDNTAFQFRDNNFLQAAFDLASTDGREHQVSVSLPHSSISMVSGNYIYTNSGPIGIGSPGPYVAESMERSYSYNRKKNKGYEEDGIFINKGYWEEEDGEYPYDQILGNWHPDETRKMMDEMAELHKEKIREISFSTLEHLTYVNADTLTKGRQTWCPFTQSSVPSDVAFATMMQILKKNNIGPLVTLADFGLAIMTLWCRPVIETIQCTWKLEPVKQRKRETLQTQTRKRYKKITTWIKIEDTGNNEVFLYVLDMARSFRSYIKHGERGLAVWSSRHSVKAGACPWDRAFRVRDKSSTMERRTTKSRLGSPSMGSPGGSCNPHAPKSAIQRLSQASTALGELNSYITREFSSAKHAKYLSLRVDLIETVHRELEDDLGLMGKIYPRLVSLEASVAHIAGCLEGLGSAGQAEAAQMDMGAIQQCVQTIVRKEVQAVQATLEAVDSRDKGEERRLLSKLTKKCDDMVEAVTGTIAGKLSPIRDQ
ncbi:hypothetical protein GE061_000241 [Apolygus lucorum]|uniref:Uncharacterized protein n=1 Tax=Apolygus lucorum TaxID=248454 RepID=A0A8S9Y6E6_APOLU|nr:hypothetical protein GE061_000241 [Apolygus lucorum]